MTEFLRDWILGLTGTAAFCAVAMLLTPKGRVRQVVQLLTGLLMALALLRPLLRPELTELSLNLSKYRAQAEALTETGEELRQSLDRSIIEGQTEAYILDKAQSLGVTLRGAKVSVQWSTQGFWYPTEVALQGNYDAALSRLIEAELGIPALAQRWTTDENQ